MAGALELHYVAGVIPLGGAFTLSSLAAWWSTHAEPFIRQALVPRQQSVTLTGQSSPTTRNVHIVLCCDNTSRENKNSAMVAGYVSSTAGLSGCLRFIISSEDFLSVWDCEVGSGARLQSSLLVFLFLSPLSLSLSPLHPSSLLSFFWVSFSALLPMVFVSNHNLNTALSTSVTYSIYVRAQNAVGTGPNSATITVTTSNNPNRM